MMCRHTGEIRRGIYFMCRHLSELRFHGQSIHWGHVERGQLTYFRAGLVL